MQDDADKFEDKEEGTNSSKEDQCSGCFQEVRTGVGKLHWFHS